MKFITLYVNAYQTHEQKPVEVRADKISMLSENLYGNGNKTFPTHVTVECGGQAQGYLAKEQVLVLKAKVEQATENS